MNSVPAHLLNRPSRGLAQSAVVGIGGNQPPHISIARNRFTLVDAAGNRKLLDTLHVDVIVVDVSEHVNKIYFDAEYDPASEDHKPPACFSDNGIGASASATSPQSVSCQLCPWNAWGSQTSRMTGKPTKACNDVKKIAVLVHGDPDAIVYQLRVPPASLKLWKGYAQTIGSYALPGAGRNYDLSDIVTRITFDDKTQGVLNFAPSPVGFYDAGYVAVIDKVWAEKKADALVGRGDMVVDAARIGAQTPAAVAHQAPKPQLAPPPAPPAAQQPQQFNAPQQPSTPFPSFSTHAPFSAQAAAQPAAPAAASPAPARRGRKPKEPEAAPTHAPFQPAPTQQVIPPGQPDDGAIPAFLQRNPAPAPAPAQPSFGMAQPAPADAGMQAAITAAFNLPTDGDDE